MSKLNNLSIKLYVQLKLIAPFLVFSLLICLFLIPHVFADGTDYLASTKSDVQANFGDGSTFKTYLLIGEVIFAAAAYIKTKNFYVFLGAVALCIFLHWGLTTWLA